MLFVSGLLQPMQCNLDWTMPQSQWTVAKPRPVHSTDVDCWQLTQGLATLGLHAHPCPSLWRWWFSPFYVFVPIICGCHELSIPNKWTEFTQVLALGGTLDITKWRCEKVKGHLTAVTETQYILHLTILCCTVLYKCVYSSPSSYCSCSWLLSFCFFIITASIIVTNN